MHSQHLYVETRDLYKFHQEIHCCSPFFCSTDLYRPQLCLCVTSLAFQSACMCLNVTFCSEKSKQYIYVPPKENLSVVEETKVFQMLDMFYLLLKELPLAGGQIKQLVIKLKTRLRKVLYRLQYKKCFKERRIKGVQLSSQLTTKWYQQLRKWKYHVHQPTHPDFNNAEFTTRMGKLLQACLIWNYQNINANCAPKVHTFYTSPQILGVAKTRT